MKPSPIGTKWGLGGTCVNVGCIPKKLMHFAAQWGENQEAERNAGWSLNQDAKMDWGKLTERIAGHIMKLNGGYEGELMSKDVDYRNCLAKIIGPH